MDSSEQKPKIVLVTGSFCDSTCFNPILPHLRSAGYSVLCIDHPSFNSPDPLTATTQADAEHLRSILLDQINERNDIVLVTHSYGGVVGPAAAKGLEKTQGASGIIGLVCIASNFAREGENVIDWFGGWPDCIKRDYPEPGLGVLTPVRDVLYNDCSEEFKAGLGEDSEPHALAAFTSKATAPCWADRGWEGRRIYVRTLRDGGNVVGSQDEWIARMSVSWDVVDLDAGHMCFISRPEETTRVIVEATGKLIALNG